MTISPFPNAAVCRVGDRLEVMCSTNESALEWEVVSVAGTNDHNIESTVTSTQQVQDVHTSNSTVLIFSRTSEHGILPLVSTLEITFVGQTMNGSTVTCMESTGRAMAPIATTTVHIVGENDGIHI